MDFTDAFYKLEADYTYSNSDFIQYGDFVHHECRIRIIYTHPDDHTYVLSLYMVYREHVILVPFYISFSDRRADLCPFFDPAIYETIKPIIAADNYSTATLFKVVVSRILNEANKTMSEDDYSTIRKTRTVIEREHQNGELYFNHLRDSDMSNVFSA